MLESVACTGIPINYVDLLLLTILVSGDKPLAIAYEIMLLSVVEEEVDIGGPTVVHDRWHALVGGPRNQDVRKFGEWRHIFDAICILIVGNQLQLCFQVTDVRTL